MEFFTREQCRALDADAIARGIPSILLMEHAALGATWVAEQMLGSLEGQRVWILCGPGNNGGDGYAMARLCHNAGARVTVWDLVSPAKIDPTSDPGINISALQALPRVLRGDASSSPPSPPAADLVVDAIFGTGLSRAPEGRFADVIRMINDVASPVLAVDIPSGLDADRGVALGETVRAHTTATFGAPKVGFREPAARQFVGELFVVPIGVPRESLPDDIPASGNPVRI